jgi:hypothetical protein
MATSSSGFDMSKMSTASKILLGGSVLLLLDSFIFSWQKACADFSALGVPGSGFCVKFSMWGGSASWAGLLTGLLVIALIAWEGMQLAGQSVDVGQPASKISAYLGFGVVVFGVLKFLLVVSNSPGLGAFIGIVLILAIGYGAWMRFQEPVAMTTTATTSPPPPPPSPSPPTTPPSDPIG